MFIKTFLVVVNGRDNFKLTSIQSQEETGQSGQTGLTDPLCPFDLNALPAVKSLSLEIILETHPLNKWLQGLFLTASFFIVALGQPAWLPWLGPIAAAVGYALMGRVLLAHPSRLHRFVLTGGWFFAVQLIQLSWFVSHPYSYIYLIYILLSLIYAVQFGLIGIFITPSTLKSPLRLISLASFWTLLEWSRLFLLSGVSWNPIGMALTSNLFSLQMASIAGVFGLSFWVILTNLQALKFWTYSRNKKNLALWLLLALTPYLFGWGHLFYHDNQIAKIDPLQSPPFKALLMQPAFSPEEASNSSARKNMVAHVIDEWRQILKICKKFEGQPFHLIALPEFVVPFGTYSFVYPLQYVKQAFLEELGPHSLKYLPPEQSPFSYMLNTESSGPQLVVNNAYWAQGIANFFNAHLLVGLEDIEGTSHRNYQYYSAALFFHPQQDGLNEEFLTYRYEKRVLIPMGEYIPFQFCKDLAAAYGVFSSFTPGKEAKVFPCHHCNLSPSICYEETFGDVISEAKQKGADLIVNLTSDVWYPNSKLARQHLDHARPRTVENGVPLIRSCNTGITAAIDSLGRTIAVLGGENPEAVEWIPDALAVDVPIYSYPTLYSRFGDSLIIGISIVALLLYSLRILTQNRKNAK